MHLCVFPLLVGGHVPLGALQGHHTWEPTGHKPGPYLLPLGVHPKPPGVEMALVFMPLFSFGLRRFRSLMFRWSFKGSPTFYPTFLAVW